MNNGIEIQEKYFRLKEQVSNLVIGTKSMKLQEQTGAYPHLHICIK